MKNNVLLLIIILGLQSCGGKDRLHRKYVLENGTEREIKIEFYRDKKTDPLFSDSINGKGILTEQISVEGKGSLPYARDAFHVSDSAVVYFDNEKYQTYKYNPFEDEEPDPVLKKNFLSDSAYIVESNTLYRFIFSEEHYKEAKWLKDL